MQLFLSDPATPRTTRLQVFTVVRLAESQSARASGESTLAQATVVGRGAGHTPLDGIRADH